MEKTWPALLESVPEVHEFVLLHARELGFTPEKIGQIEVAVEEIIVNIISYALHNKQGGQIRVSLEKYPSKLVIQVSDDGLPFDPLQAPEPDIHAPANKRVAGGLGIFLARSMVDDMNYTRENGKNVLTMVKLL